MSEEACTGTNEQPYYGGQIKAVGRNFRGGKAENIEIQPGMTATVEIKTGSNTILRFLTKPVTKTITESMGDVDCYGDPVFFQYCVWKENTAPCA